MWLVPDANAAVSGVCSTGDWVVAVLGGLGAVPAGADEALWVRLLDPLLGTADALDGDSCDIVGLMA